MNEKSSNLDDEEIDQQVTTGNIEVFHDSHEPSVAAGNYLARDLFINTAKATKVSRPFARVFAAIKKWLKWPVFNKYTIRGNPSSAFELINSTYPLPHSRGCRT